jgi:hypothetical protein
MVQVKEHKNESAQQAHQWYFGQKQSANHLCAWEVTAQEAAPGALETNQEELTFQLSAVVRERRSHCCRPLPELFSASVELVTEKNYCSVFTELSTLDLMTILCLRCSILPSRYGLQIL